MKIAYATLSLVFALVSIALAHAGETHKNGTSLPGDDKTVEPGDYVVLVDDDDPRSVKDIIKELGAEDDPIHHIYENSYFKGFAASMSKDCAAKLPKFPGIRMYEKFTEFRTTEVQADTTWGLRRISKTNAVGADQDPEALAYNYAFNNKPCGAGVNIYMIDTGINVNHIDFKGRAKFGFTFDNTTFFDDNGHGTHTAGTAASDTLGVAKNANLIAVKVLDASGSGNNSQIIAGIDWAVKDHEEKSKQPGFRGSILSMSLGSDTRSPALDDAVVRASTIAKMHVSVAAGNSGKDACLSSPSFASSIDSASIITVGAIDIGDGRAFFSNVGPCVTTYAPGVRVLSTFIDKANPENGPNNLIQALDGTSMACPHVTGLIAYYLGENSNLALDPKGMKDLIVKNSVQSSALGPAGIPNDPQIIATNQGVPLSRRAIRGMKPWRRM